MIHRWQLDMLNNMKRYKGRGFIQITGRNAGKSSMDAYVRLWNDIMNTTRSIQWERIKKRSLRAYPGPSDPSFSSRSWGLNEYDLDPVQAWCDEHNCGTRTSFDTFKFRTEAEITMFLLRWGSNG